MSFETPYHVQILGWTNNSSYKNSSKSMVNYYVLNISRYKVNTQSICARLVTLEENNFNAHWHFYDLKKKILTGQ